MKLNEKPLVSVIMCEHNTPLDFFGEAVQSVLSQTYGNFELIIIDDASNNDLSNLSYLNDKRIKIFRNHVNIGLAASRNKGIEHSKGKYIAIMDTDDICSPKRLSEQVKFMEKHKDVLCAGSYVELFGERNAKQRYSIKNNEYYRSCLLFGNSPTITNPSVIIRSWVFKEGLVKYDESLKTAEDYDMWVQLSQIGKMDIIKKVLLKYRIRKGQMSDRFREKGSNDCEVRIKHKQIDKIGLDVDGKLEQFLKIDFRSENIKPFEYLCFLENIKKHNRVSNYLNRHQLAKRCWRQWKQKVYSIKSREIFKNLMKELSLINKLKVIFIEITRPLNIFITIHDYLRSL